MSDLSTSENIDQAIALLDEQHHGGQLSPGAIENIRNWLTDEKYVPYREQVVAHLQNGQWKELDDAFWTVIPFGTGGRRGRMYPIGSNAINDRTIGESAQGLAQYVKQCHSDGPWSCAIAYDTRHRSREFAELCAGIMVANGFKVYFIDQYRSTPELSFLIRYKSCHCGIMVTASHNPPSDNAVKVYWSNGGQLVPPHDQAVIDEVMKVGQIPQTDFQNALDQGDVEICTDEVDAALLEEHQKISFDGPRDLKVIFSPLHGVGEFNVRTLLNATGFHDLEIYGPHREPSGDFPNVPGHVSNPENPRVFDAIIEHAKQTGAELILASDPDCDRMGAAAPVSLDANADWETLNGNQLGALLTDYVFSQRAANGLVNKADYFVTTLVTSPLTCRIAKSYGGRVFDQNLVGFKWIGAEMERQGPAGFVFATEESHGYLAGTHVRDKDGAIACQLMSELAALCKSKGQSVHAKLDELYRQHGYHAERLATIQMEGSDGMARMKSLMETLRSDAPNSIGGMNVKGIRDYLNSQTNIGGETSPLEGPVGNLIMLDTELEGNFVAIRPSGTEPKVKMYMFTFVPPDEIQDLAIAKAEMEARLDGFDQDMQAFADTIA